MHGHLIPVIFAMISLHRKGLISQLLLLSCVGRVKEADEADEEEDDRDLQSQDGSSEDELQTAHGETQKGLNTSIVPPVNATDTLQGGVAVLLANATGRAADDTALTSSGSALNNTASVDLSSLQARGAAVDIGNKLLANSGSPGENQNLQINKNGAAADSVAVHGTSS